MAQGSYEVNKENIEAGDTAVGEPAVRDVSYRSCLCALLIFLAFCLILTFVGLKFSGRGGPVKEEVKKDVYTKGEVALVGRDRPTTTTETPISETLKPTIFGTKKTSTSTSPSTTRSDTTSIKATTLMPKNTSKTILVASTTPKPATTLQPATTSSNKIQTHVTTLLNTLSPSMTTLKVSYGQPPIPLTTTATTKSTTEMMIPNTTTTSVSVNSTVSSTTPLPIAPVVTHARAQPTVPPTTALSSKPIVSTTTSTIYNSSITATPHTYSKLIAPATTATPTKVITPATTISSSTTTATTHTYSKLMAVATTATPTKLIAPATTPIQTKPIVPATTTTPTKSTVAETPTPTKLKVPATTVTPIKPVPTTTPTQTKSEVLTTNVTSTTLASKFAKLIVPVTTTTTSKPTVVETPTSTKLKEPAFTVISTKPIVPTTTPTQTKPIVLAAIATQTKPIVPIITATSTKPIGVVTTFMSTKPKLQETTLVVTKPVVTNASLITTMLNKFNDSVTTVTSAKPTTTDVRINIFEAAPIITTTTVNNTSLTTTTLSFINTTLGSVLTTIPPPVKPSVRTTTPKPAPTPSPTTKQISTTVDDWTSDNYWNDTSTETDFSPLIRRSLPVCTTAACKSTGSRMLSLMDYSTDPCDDFYQFSCGGIKDEVAEVDTWRRLFEQLYLIDNESPVYLQKYKIFYDSCVTHEHEFNYGNRVNAILQLVKEVGEITFSKKEDTMFDLTQLFAKLILRQSLRIMDVDVDTDAKSTKFLIKINIPKQLSVLKETGPWSALTDDQHRCLSEQKKELHAENINLTGVHGAYLECQKNQGIYLNSIETVVRSLGFLTGDEFTQTQQIQDLRTTIEWGILDHLNELPAPNEQRKSVLYKKYELQKVMDLQASYTFLKWKDLLETLTGHTIEGTTPIQVYFPGYFKKLFGELQKLQKWKINNALIAMYAQDLYENLVIPQAKHNREDYCVRVAAKVFPDISSHLYMKTWPWKEVEEAQKLLTKIFTQLKAKLTESLQKAEWVDAGSKIPMFSKLKNKINLVFNKQDDIYNDINTLKARYNGVMLNESNFMENAVKMLQASKKSLFDLQGKLYNVKYTWGNFINAWDREPKSFYASGLVAVPMGVIKIPVREEFPGYLMMSQLGLSLARELARQFDLVGIQRGITLSPSFKRSFRGFRKIMEDKTILKGTRIHQKHKITFEADPQLSANERIVDNTATRLITDSFHSLGEESVLPWVSTSYSREKIFFITIAQEYCKNIDMTDYMDYLFESEVLPPALRVENIVTNSEAFQKVFECPDGSAMNNNPNFKTQFPYLQKTEESEDDEDLDESDDYLSNNQL